MAPDLHLRHLTGPLAGSEQQISELGAWPCLGECFDNKSRERFVHALRSRLDIDNNDSHCLPEGGS
jgi:hypothetical protein